MILEEYSPPFADYYLYYPKRQHVSPTLRALIDHLQFERANPQHVASTTSVSASVDIGPGALLMTGTLAPVAWYSRMPARLASIL